MPEVRLQKVLAEAGIASRRAAEGLIGEGRVRVNGALATIGQRVDPEGDAITVDGRPLPLPPRHIYLALDKPAGVTTTVRDRHAATTVLEVVPEELRRRAGRLYPVGRLDRDSEGLLLLTNDGDWAQRVLHPRHELEREYAVGLAAPLTGDQARALRDGIPLEEGLARLAVLRAATDPERRKLAASVVPGPEGLVWYRATLAQGWRRQLRRMFAAVGAPVRRLVRVRIGSLWLEGLRAGEVRELTAAEVRRLSSSR
jgi:23S rRNA pseudouridine2605 synthase